MRRACAEVEPTETTESLWRTRRRRSAPRRTRYNRLVAVSRLWKGGDSLNEVDSALSPYQARASEVVADVRPQPDFCPVRSTSPAGRRDLDILETLAVEVMRRGF